MPRQRPVSLGSSRGRRCFTTPGCMALTRDRLDLDAGTVRYDRQLVSTRPAEPTFT